MYIHVYAVRFSHFPRSSDTVGCEKYVGIILLRDGDAQKMALREGVREWAR